MDEHEFTATIRSILDEEFGEFGAGIGNLLLGSSQLLQYLNIKTRSANRGSKARGSFANLYAIYVLVEDYLRVRGSYSDYEGAQFSALFARQRELPFGERLQNHALNSRLNEEYKKYFPTTEYLPILRDLTTSRYWFNEALLRCQISTTREVNIAPAVLKIIDAYVQAKRDAFELFVASCQRLSTVGKDTADKGIKFVNSLLAPESDARIFEIVSFSILKASYAAQSIWIGPEKNTVKKQPLMLYKTGRTNANDGGIDFVMRPYGRFYQVTETLDLRKYFLDIDKIQRFPITFVIKTELPRDEIVSRIRNYAQQAFTAKRVVDAYMEAVEEIITLVELRDHLNGICVSGRFGEVLSEMVLQARVEFNMVDGDDLEMTATSLAIDDEDDGELP